MSSFDQFRWYGLAPADAWFFRDGRPSNRGEDQSDLQSIFPPHSQTVVGAIRAALARESGWNGRDDWSDDIKKTLGDGFENLGELSFLGPLIALNNQPVFPLPGHVIGTTSRDSIDGRMRFTPRDWLVPSTKPVLCDSSDEPTILPVAAGLVRPAIEEKHFSHGGDFYVTSDGMAKTLNGQLPDVSDCVHRDELFVHEPRIGIRREEDTRTTGERAMYSPHYVRLQEGVSLLMGVHGMSGSIDLPHSFPLGGESRMAECLKIDAPKMPNHASSGQVVVLSSSAFFGCEGSAKWFGGAPADPASHLHNTFTGQISTARVDRPIRIGGFDSRKATKGPLPLTPYAAAGTVWWLEKPSAAPSSLLLLGRRTAYGNGLAFLGAMPTV